jgi:hypothetical protein
MSSRTLTAGAGLALVAGLAGCGGGGGKESARATPTPTPSGIISSAFARSVKLDTPRAQFDARAKVEPVKTTREHEGASRFDTKKAPPKKRKEAIARWGKPNKQGVVVIPARDYTCLHYRGENPDKFGWKFCFDAKDTLQYVVTENPLPEAN